MPLFGDDPQKRHAISLALMNMGGRMLQPSPVKQNIWSTLGQFIPGVANQYFSNMEAQRKALQDTQEHDAMQQYRKAATEHMGYEGESKKYDLMAKRQEQEMLNALPGMVVSTQGNIPEQGYSEITLAEEIAKMTSQPKVYKNMFMKSPSTMLKFIEKNMDKLGPKTVQTPLGDMSIGEIPTWLGKWMFPDTKEKEPKRYSVGGALVDAEGKVYYKSPEKKGSGGGGEGKLSGEAKIGNLKAVKDMVDEKFMSLVPPTPGLYGMEETVKKAEIYSKMDRVQRRAYDFILQKAQQYAGSMSPADAVAQATHEYWSKFHTNEQYNKYYPPTGRQAQPAQSTEEYTQEDLEYTAKKHGITVEEVIKRIGMK